MDSWILTTERCELIPVRPQDAVWMYELFNTIRQIESLDGIKMFCSSIEETERFIKSFIKSAARSEGFLWTINHEAKPIGFISVYDVKENPFYTYGLFPCWQRKGFFHGILDRCEAFVESVLYEGESLLGRINRNNKIDETTYKTNTYAVGTGDDYLYTEDWTACDETENTIR